VTRRLLSFGPERATRNLTQIKNWILPACITSCGSEPERALVGDRPACGSDTLTLSAAFRGSCKQRRLGQLQGRGSVGPAASLLRHLTALREITMNPLTKAVNLAMAAATIAAFASSAGATPLSAGSLPMRDAAAPTFESVQWRGWGGWRGGWGGWGWGGLGFGLATTGAIIGGALASAPYYGYYSPYYDSALYYPPPYYSYVPAYYGNAAAYYGNYGYYGGYWPYGLYDYSPSRHNGLGNRHVLVKHH
jgi:hypothetical protein